MAVFDARHPPPHHHRWPSTAAASTAPPLLSLRIRLCVCSARSSCRKPLRNPAGRQARRSSAHMVGAGVTPQSRHSITRLPSSRSRAARCPPRLRHLRRPRRRRPRRQQRRRGSRRSGRRRPRCRCHRRRRHARRCESFARRVSAGPCHRAEGERRGGAEGGVECQGRDGKRWRHPRLRCEWWITALRRPTDTQSRRERGD